MNEVKYFLIPERETVSIERDFDQLIAFASKYDKAVHTKSPVTIELEEPDGKKHNSKLEIQKDHIIFTTTRSNDFTIENIRSAASKAEYRVFSVELGCFLPTNVYLRDLITYNIDRTSEDILLKADYKPVFSFSVDRKHNVIYAKKGESKEIYIISPYILDYYKTYGYESVDTQELSYVVSPDITDFAATFDAGLVPIDFYEGYRKKDKIFNYSYFDIYKPGRKIFVKPIVLELDDHKGMFFMKVGEKGAMILMDKIREGETLHDTIMRFLSENDLADSYIGAVVGRDVEFDRDREGILTPRLIVKVFVRKFKTMPEKLKRSWFSTPK